MSGAAVFRKLLLATIALFATAYGQTNETVNYFVRPPKPAPTHDFANNPEYAVGSTLSWRFSTSWNPIRFGIFQGVFDPLEAPPQFHFSSWSDVGDGIGFLEGEWTVSLNLSYMSPPIVFDLGRGHCTLRRLATSAPSNRATDFGFVVQDGGASRNLFISHAFNISDPISSASSAAASATTISSSTSIPTTSPSSSSVDHNLLQPESTSKPSSSTGEAKDLSTAARASSGLSRSAIVGLGAGLGLGLGCVLIGLGAFFLIRRRRRSNEGPVYGSPIHERTGDLERIEDHNVPKDRQ